MLIVSPAQGFQKNISQIHDHSQEYLTEFGYSLVLKLQKKRTFYIFGYIQLKKFCEF
jgi:hypothetical protein